MELFFHERFLDSLIEIENYLSLHISKQNARKFPSDIFEFITNSIEKHPLAFSLGNYKNAKNKLVRKAVFKKNHIIVFEIEDDTINILNIYHTSRDPDNIEI
jgi:plasmid stabilization system protein ParE